MKVKLSRNYRSKKGNTVFVYTVSGTEKQLAEYKAAQGDNYREDDKGVPLWFTTRCIGPAGTLIITQKGKVVPDMSAFEAAASLSAQFGGNFGAELAKASVHALLGNSGNSNAVAEAVPSAEGIDKM